MSVTKPLIVITLALLFIAVLLNWERPPMETAQTGYRGTGMATVQNPRLEERRRQAVDVVPVVIDPVEPYGQKASEVYENVPVLGHLDEGEFIRLMTAITEWVSPEQGCGYCHNLDNLADESPYTKRVSRRMIQMTQAINTDWTNHVAQTGVTCYTCHRGKPVPEKVWYENQGLPQARGMAADRQGQNLATGAVGYTSLPYDPFKNLLLLSDEIRVVPNTALPTPPQKPGIKAAEASYGLMIHMSRALGVNCTFCHNSRSFMSWDQSRTQRTTAFHGIRLSRDINANYLEPLESMFPANRLGPQGDVAKVNCETCHRGASKPLNGISMLKDYLVALTPAAAVVDDEAAVEPEPADDGATTIIVPVEEEPEAAPGEDDAATAPTQTETITTTVPVEEETAPVVEDDDAATQQ